MNNEHSIYIYLPDTQRGFRLLVAAAEFESLCFRILIVCVIGQKRLELRTFQGHHQAIDHDGGVRLHSGVWRGVGVCCILSAAMTCYI